MTDKNTTTTIPAGWKLVPIEPTPEMIDAGTDAGVSAAPSPWCPETYRAMLRAAPSPTPAAPSAGQWMPIETAPKDGTPVLIWGATLCVPGEMVVGIRSDEHDDLELWDIHDGKHGPYRLRGPSPTHWMPLPAAPGAQPAQDMTETAIDHVRQFVSGMDRFADNHPISLGLEDDPEISLDGLDLDEPSPLTLGDLRALSAARAAQPVGEVEKLTDDIVRTALQEAWNDYCDDAQAFPDCFWITRGPKLFADFSRCSNFITMVRLALEAAMLGGSERPAIHTTIVDGCAVHGDAPLPDKSYQAVSAVIAAARNRLKQTIDIHAPEVMEALPKEPTEAHLSAIWTALGWRKCENAINEAKSVYQALRRAALRSGEGR